MKVFLLFFAIFTYYQRAEGLHCFACTVQNSESDQTCVTDPAKVPGAIVPCKKKYCTSMRQEFKDPPDTVSSFYRGCEDQPVKLNTEIEDDNFIYYYRACIDDLCNGGLGKDSSSGSNLGEDDGEGILRVPGSNSTTIAIAINTLIFLVSFSIVFLIRNQ